MALSYPSVQCFYKRETPKLRQIPSDASDNQVPLISNGFTQKEIDEALDPVRRPWKPSREYEERSIDQLVRGPKAVTFTGRVVNFSTIYGQSTNQSKAAGWHYIIVKDNTAAISLKLYFAQRAYPLALGQLLSIWTAFISDVTKAKISTNTTMFANVFPGRNTSDHVVLDARSIDIVTCDTPLGYKQGSPLADLMTLGSYLTGGHEVIDAKILVCVKSIGARKEFNIKKTSTKRNLREVMLFDHTGELKLKLWGEVCEASKDWHPSMTVLLISNPRFTMDFRGTGVITLVSSTMIEKDPRFPDAEWLKKYAIDRTKKESMCLEFPDGVWDVEAAVHGKQRTLFTLAEIDQWVRDDSSQIIMGWLNVVILELFLVFYHCKKMFFCAECCGLPTFANTSTSSCPHCERCLKLSLNTRIIGPLIDETGCIATGKLVWSPQAWEDLFGHSMAELGAMTGSEIKILESKYLGLRCHLCFGWDERVGRLAILAMRP